MSLPPELAGYQVVAELGRGGMGVVYEVRAPDDPRPLALKLISGEGVDAEAILRFGRETELLAKVQHPNVLRIVNGGTLASGRPFLVTERIDGEDLDARLRRGPLDAEASARLVRALCDAVAHLHEQGILHRDLKPHNVMLRADGSPVLLDFGLARDPGAQTLTQSGLLLGTPGFMAPEQVDAKAYADLDARVDVYGLGGILYFVLCGRPPIAASSGLVAMAYATLNTPVDWSPASGAPAALVAIGDRALAKASEARYPTAAAMRDDLDRFLADGTVEAPPRRRGRGLALALGVLSLLVLGWLAVPRSAPTQPTEPIPSPTPPTAATGDGLPPLSGFRLTTLAPRGEHSGAAGAVGCELFGPRTVLFFCGHRRAILRWRRGTEGWAVQKRVELDYQPRFMAQAWETSSGPLLLIAGDAEKHPLLAYQGENLDQAGGKLSLEDRRLDSDRWGTIEGIHLLPAKNGAVLIHSEGFLTALSELPLIRIRWGSKVESRIKWGQVAHMQWKRGRPRGAYKHFEGAPAGIDLLAADTFGAVLAASGKQLAYWPTRDAHAPQPRSHTFRLPRRLTALAAGADRGAWGDARGRLAWSEWQGWTLETPVLKPTEQLLTSEDGHPVVALAIDDQGVLYALRGDRLQVFDLTKRPPPLLQEVALEHPYRSARVLRDGDGGRLLLVRRDRCAVEIYDAKALRAPPK